MKGENTKTSNQKTVIGCKLGPKKPATQKDGSCGKSVLNTQVTVLSHSKRRFYGHGIPGVNWEKLRGKLVVVEGADGSGRSTQISKLVEWLEGQGHATVQVGLTRSDLVKEELENAKRGNVVSHRTLSLFYATDFADQLENVILPALRSGRMVLADRYIYTLMARDLVRGMDPEWVENLYGIALEPDAVFYLNLSPEKLIERNFLKSHSLNYWESGMDLGISQDWFESFTVFQCRLLKEFKKLQKRFGFNIIDASHSVNVVHNILKEKLKTVLNSK